MIARSLLFSRLHFFLLASLVVLMPHANAQHALPNHLSKRAVGDYGYWSKYQTPAYGAAQIPYHKLTHINHAGVSFDSTGTLSVPQGFLEPELNNLAHAAGVKVMLLLGGDFQGSKPAEQSRRWWTTSQPSNSSTATTAPISTGSIRKRAWIVPSWWT